MYLSCGVVNSTVHSAPRGLCRRCLLNPLPPALCHRHMCKKLNTERGILHRITDMLRHGGSLANGGKHQPCGRDSANKDKTNTRAKREHKGRTHFMWTEEDVPQQESQQQEENTDRAFHTAPRNCCGKPAGARAETQHICRWKASRKATAAVAHCLQTASRGQTDISLASTLAPILSVVFSVRRWSVHGDDHSTQNAHLRVCACPMLSPRRILPPEHRGLPAHAPSPTSSKPHNLSGITGFPSRDVRGTG